MVDTGVDKNRRRVLIAATSVVGAAGVAAIATPFLSSWSPSARALAAGAPVEVPVGKVEPGQQIRVIWRGKPVWIVNRTEEMLAGLPSNDGNLKDPNSDDIKQQPEYAKNPARTREGKEKYLVLVGICTHLGCSPTYRPELSWLIWVLIGRAVGIAHATVLGSIWLDVCSKTFQLELTCKCRRTISKTITRC